MKYLYRPSRITSRLSLSGCQAQTIVRWCIILGFALSGGCTKFVQVGSPSNAISSSTVYGSNATAGAPMTSIYADMTNSVTMAAGTYGISLTAGLSADELTNYINSNITLQQYYSNALKSSANYFWNEPYQYIYIANATLEGLSTSTAVTMSTSRAMRLPRLPHPARIRATPTCPP